jgi:RNA polymerase sigma-70 factor (family 1)
MQKEIESAYIKELKRGSRQAFTALYNIYSARLYGYCYQWTKSHEDSEEVVQDVFVKLWMHRDAIQDENTILYFIFRIAKNQLINKYRINLNSPVFEEYIQYNNEMLLSVNNASQPLEYDEFCILLNKIKKTLPKTQQQVYEYSVCQQKSNKEIAETMCLSEQTVKNQLSLALKVFRQKLGKYGYMYLLITIMLS